MESPCTRHQCWESRTAAATHYSECDSSTLSQDCRLSTYTVGTKVITPFLIAFAWAWVWGGVGSMCNMCDDTGYINMQCATLSMCRNYHANPGKNAGSLMHTYTYTFPRSYILTYSLLGWRTKVHGADCWRLHFNLQKWCKIVNSSAHIVLKLRMFPPVTLSAEQSWGYYWMYLSVIKVKCILI